jgi:hypothetical protein
MKLQFHLHQGLLHVLDMGGRILHQPFSLAQISTQSVHLGTGAKAPAQQTIRMQLAIRDRYGRPGKGNDKGSVEGLVGYARRNFMVPIPQFPTWAAFNDWLEEQCRKRQRDRLRGESETIGERLRRDLAAMRALPASPFDACDQASARVTAQSLVRYKTNDYSVPSLMAIRMPGSEAMSTRW